MPLLTGTLAVKVLTEPADRLIPRTTGAGHGNSSDNLDLSTLTSLGTISLDVTQAVRRKPVAGQHVVSFRIESSNASAVLKVAPVGLTGSETDVAITTAPKRDHRRPVR